MKYLRLVMIFFRVGLMAELAYLTNFFINLFQSLHSLGISLAGLGVIFSHTDSLGGWRPDEMLALVGVYFLVGGILNLVIRPSMAQLIESVHEGTLDFTLIKPEDTQFIVSTQSVEIWELINIVMGVGLLITAQVMMGAKVGIMQAATFVLLLFCGGVIIYSFFLILATLSFWFVRVENFLTIFQSMYEAGRWPISLYPGWLRYGLTFIIPVAFATTVPTEALTARLSWINILIAIILSLVLVVLSRRFWLAGLKHYSGASS